MTKTAQRLEEQRQQKLKIIPEKYILLIKTPRKAYVIEGRKDFTEYNNRQATTTAWFEFMLRLSRLSGLDSLNKKFRVAYFSPIIAMPERFYGMTLQHVQDGTVCFGGRIFSNCETDSQATTVELLAYFDELAELCDEEVRAHLEEFNFAIHEL